MSSWVSTKLRQLLILSLWTIYLLNWFAFVRLTLYHIHRWLWFKQIIVIETEIATVFLRYFFGVYLKGNSIGYWRKGRTKFPRSFVYSSRKRVCFVACRVCVVSCLFHSLVRLISALNSLTCKALSLSLSTFLQWPQGLKSLGWELSHLILQRVFLWIKKYYSILKLHYLKRQESYRIETYETYWLEKH